MQLESNTKNIQHFKMKYMKINNKCISGSVHCTRLSNMRTQISIHVAAARCRLNVCLTGQSKHDRRVWCEYILHALIPCSLHSEFHRNKPADTALLHYAVWTEAGALVSLSRGELNSLQRKKDLVVSSAAPVCAGLPLVPVHAGIPLCEPPPSP